MPVAISLHFMTVWTWWPPNNDLRPSSCVQAPRERTDMSFKSGSMPSSTSAVAVAFLHDNCKSSSGRDLDSNHIRSNVLVTDVNLKIFSTLVERRVPPTLKCHYIPWIQQQQPGHTNPINIVKTEFIWFTWTNPVLEGLTLILIFQFDRIGHELWAKLLNNVLVTSSSSSLPPTHMHCRRERCLDLGVLWMKALVWSIWRNF
jgi:hypothetical protein